MQSLKTKQEINIFGYISGNPSNTFSPNSFIKNLN